MFVSESIDTPDDSNGLILVSFPPSLQLALAACVSYPSTCAQEQISLDSGEPPVVKSLKKRGRPPKSPHQPLPIAASMAVGLGLDISDESDFESDSECSKRRRMTALDSARRRSHRGKKMDTSKPILVLMPHMDARAILDAKSDSDWESLQAALNMDDDYWESDAEQGHSHGHGAVAVGAVVAVKQEVFTPKVTEHGLFRRISQPRGIAVDYDMCYVDYDACSEDEEMLAALQEEIASDAAKRALTAGLLEKMICKLERELELIRSFRKPFADGQSTLEITQRMLEDSHTMISQLAAGTTPTVLPDRTPCVETVEEKRLPNGLEGLEKLTEEDLKKWFPDQRVSSLLLPLLHDCCGYEAKIVQRVHAHWRSHAIGRHQSLLRAYHRFRMHLWTSTSKASLPIDYTASSLLEAYSHLQYHRRNLDRSRLIIDRLRRREKIKKDLLRTSMDMLSVSGLLGFPPTVEAFDASGVPLPPPDMPLDGSAVSIVRKRGRPRRADSITSQPETPMAAVKMRMPVGIIKLVQGRDKFGKFLRKAPVMVGSKARQAKALAMAAGAATDLSAVPMRPVLSMTSEETSTEDASTAQVDFALLGENGLEYDTDSSSEEEDEEAGTDHEEEGPDDGMMDVSTISFTPTSVTQSDPLVNGLDDSCSDMLRELPQLLAEDPTPVPVDQ